MNKIYIYTLKDPRNGEIRYIGKTNNLKKRFIGHLADARVQRYNNHNCKWISSLLKNNHKPIMEILDELENENNWEWLEQYWISQFKSWGFNLTNLTKGGDGNKGQKMSKESNLKRAQSLKGQTRTIEQRKNISNGSKGKKLTDITKSKLRIITIKQLGRPIVQLNLITKEFIKNWECIKDAGKEFNIDPTSISNCCKGKYKKSCGYYWMYLNEYNKLKDMTRSAGNGGEIISVDDTRETIISK